MWGVRSWLALLSVAAIIAAGVWWLLRDDRLPPIARDVPYATIDGNLVFSERVRQHYPVGMKVLELRGELKRDGFVLDPEKPYEGDGSGRLTRENLLCRKIWAIAWKASQEGRIKTVGGSFDRHCMWD